ncbi:cytochrome P450 315a1, mitochondrial [Armigeres subalbatus]|uniref:cytochrome P450 315a1, mitochondrial n=1 Tax=Armigeres subalbatus TaxID=124917 RepID=UPI002ED255CF
MCYASKILKSHMRLMSSVASGTARSFQLLPGPRRFPLLGTINDIIHLGNPKTLHLTISNHHKKYGPIFRIKISNIDAIFLKDPEMMRTVFSYEGKFPKHPLPEAWTYYNKKHNCKRGLFFMDDEEWLHYRKLLNQPLMRNVGWMIEPIKRVCDNTIKSFPEKATNCDNGGQKFELRNAEAILYKWSIEVILSLMLGNSYNPKSVNRLSELVEQFSQTVYQIFLYSSKLMAVPPKLADRMQLDAWKQFETIVPKTLSIANKIIDISMDEIERGDGLLSKLQDCISSRDTIKRIFADFIIAAGDTTAFATLWCLYLLAKNPNVQTAVRNGIQGDFFESPLIRGTVKETLRLFPVAPFVGRFLDTDAVIGGHHIPKNALALLSLYTAGRDEDNFYKPNEFLPERWIRRGDKNLSLTPFSPNASLPFSMGSRSCIGRKVALIQMQYLLSKVLSEYHLTVLNKKEVNAELKMITVPNSEINLAFHKL